MTRFVCFSVYMERRGETVLAMSFTLDRSKFVPTPPTVVGKILPDGSIENTHYKFDKREISGGVAITNNSRLQRAGGSIINPATGEVFVETKKKTGFFSKTTKTFIKPWGEQ